MIDFEKELHDCPTDEIAEDGSLDWGGVIAWGKSIAARVWEESYAACLNAKLKGDALSLIPNPYSPSDAAKGIK